MEIKKKKRTSTTVCCPPFYLLVKGHRNQTTWWLCRRHRYKIYVATFLTVRDIIGKKSQADCCWQPYHKNVSFIGAIFSIYSSGFLFNHCSRRSVRGKNDLIIVKVIILITIIIIIHHLCGVCSKGERIMNKNFYYACSMFILWLSCGSWIENEQMLYCAVEDRFVPKP